MDKEYIIFGGRGYGKGGIIERAMANVKFKEDPHDMELLEEVREDGRLTKDGEPAVCGNCHNYDEVDEKCWLIPEWGKQTTSSNEPGCQEWKERCLEDDAG